MGRRKKTKNEGTSKNSKNAESTINTSNSSGPEDTPQKDTIFSKLVKRNENTGSRASSRESKRRSHSKSKSRDRSRQMSPDEPKGANFGESYISTQSWDDQEDFVDRSTLSSFSSPERGRSQKWGPRSFQGKGKPENSQVTAGKSITECEPDIELNYQQFENEFNTFGVFGKNRNISEIPGHLFKAIPADNSVMYFVGADLKMPTGIPPQFLEHFKHIDKLQNLDLGLGEVGFLHNPETGRFTYYLMKKDSSPDLFLLFKCLYNMRRHMFQNHVAKLVIPQIGRDSSWPKFENMLNFLFRNLKMDVSIYTTGRKEPESTSRSFNWGRLPPRLGYGFQSFKLDYEENNLAECETNLQEVEQDLFQLDEKYALAHCVAEDMGMSSGIAVDFRQKFNHVIELLGQHEEMGGLATLKTPKGRWVYYLVTKVVSHFKPTYDSMFSSLLRLAEHTKRENVEFLAMPKIGCGLDRLEWSMVKKMIKYVFRGRQIEIVVCDFKPSESRVQQYQSRSFLSKCVNVSYPIENIENGTIVLFLLTADKLEPTPEMRKLDEKFSIKGDVQVGRALGECIIIERLELHYVLCGCVVRKNPADPIDFEAFFKCIKTIQGFRKKYDYSFIGIQAPDQNISTNYKILNLFRTTLKPYTLYMCWPGDLTKQMPSTNREEGDPANTSLNSSTDTTGGRRSINASYSNKSFSQSSRTSN